MRLPSIFLALALLAPLGCESSSDDFETEQARNDCDRGCDNLNRGIDNCASGQVLAECKRACLTVSPTDASSYASCVDGHFFDDTGDCSVSECLSTLSVSTTDPTNNSASNGMTDTSAATCKANCDAIELDCAAETDAGVTADCKGSCDTSTEDALQSFNSCAGNNRYICSDLVPCYDHLGVFL